MVVAAIAVKLSWPTPVLLWLVVLAALPIRAVAAATLNTSQVTLTSMGTRPVALLMKLTALLALPASATLAKALELWLLLWLPLAFKPSAPLALLLKAMVVAAVPVRGGHCSNALASKAPDSNVALISSRSRCRR
jgi:hypothetical protein